MRKPDDRCGAGADVPGGGTGCIGRARGPAGADPCGVDGTMGAISGGGVGAGALTGAEGDGDGDGGVDGVGAVGPPATELPDGPATAAARASGEISTGAEPDVTFCCVPTYIGFKSSAVISCPRTMCGVMIMTMSV